MNGDLNGDINGELIRGGKWGSRTSRRSRREKLEQEDAEMAERIDDLDLPEIENDPIQVTVHDTDSIGSHEGPDLDYISSSRFGGGVIKLSKDETLDGKGFDSYYMNVPSTTFVHEIALYLDKAWKLRSPNIVLSVITSNSYGKRWKNQKQIEEFQKGIIQATNTTEMWIVTNGLDQGITKIIGDAIHEERLRRNIPLMNLAFNFMDIQFEQELPKLTLIGIVPKSKLRYKELLDGDHSGPLAIQNEGRTSKSVMSELNQHHTHFILVEKLAKADDVEDLRVELEDRFQAPIGKCKRYRKIVSIATDSSSGEEGGAVKQLDDVTTVVKTDTPVVGLLLQGGSAQITHIAELLKRKIPVIIVKGTGAAADLIAFVLQEIQERGDSDHLESYIKPELLVRLMKSFPSEFKDNEIARNKCRDKILECVDSAFQDGQKFLTVIDSEGITPDLRNLNKYILSALFQAHGTRHSIKFQDRLQHDLKLTLDWNTCDLARTQIFEKNDWAKIKVPPFLFDNALLKPDREDFVDLFLEKKSVNIHKYLHHKKLLYLFNSLHNPEYFMTLCLESVLERALDTAYPIKKKFIVGDNCELNWLMYKLTNIKRLISAYDLSMNAVGRYVHDVAVAERRALNTLVFWAALTYNTKLTKTLWKYTDDPMAMSLMVSMIWHNMATVCYRDVDTKQKLKKSAIEFGQLAVKMLDITYRENPALAIAILEKPLSDYNNHTVIEIAKMGRNKMFIAHCICQKWLARKWFGNLNIREVDFKAFRLPDWFKIYMSMLLIFPMFIWITFERGKKTRHKHDMLEVDEEVIDDEALMMKPIQTSERWKPKPVLVEIKQILSPVTHWILSPVTHGVNTLTHGVKYRIDRMISYGKQNLKVPIHLQFYYFWSAPIVKFWLSQLFYIIYLIVFSYSVIVPSCGNIKVDFLVFIWTALIWMEIVRTTFVKKKKYLEIRLFWTVAEIFLMGAFVITFCLVRIVPHYINYMNYMTTKFILSVGLLYFYYRTLFVFLRISPVLGPMLISIKRMVKVDFLTWMRLFLLVMVAGGITIQATLYPNYPFNLENITKALARAFFAMFLTKIDDLDGDESCSFLYENASLTKCRAPTTDIFSANASSTPYWFISKEMSTCPYRSYGGYFVVIQYLLLIKLVLVTLLYALFSATQAQVKSESDYIWKYQKYSLIIDFDESLRLPPPLTIISYLLMLCEAIYNWTRHCLKRCKKCCQRCCKKNNWLHRKTTTVKVKRSEEFIYWRTCVRRLIQEEENQKVESTRGVIQSQIMQTLKLEIDKQKTSNKKLSQQVARLERGLISCQISLETIQHLLESFESKKSSAASKEDAMTVHMESRKSPYPGTQISRYPVFDKYVPWQVHYPSYDPALYTCPIEEYPEEIRMYIDPDLLEFIENIESNKIGDESVEAYKQANPRFTPSWNDKSVATIGDVKVTLDRTSWMTTDGIPISYDIDSSQIPQNPFGRTGLRGRGKLWRWGPNHNIMAVISRWKKISATEYKCVDGKYVLEFITIDSKDKDGHILPRAKDYGNMSVYSVICRKFQKYVINGDVTAMDPWMSKKDMKEYFATFSVKNVAPMLGFSTQMIYRGYFDDSMNTDNAWNEAEVWNLHYPGATTLDEKIKNKDDIWTECSSAIKIFGNQDFIIQKAATLHGAYY